MNLQTGENLNATNIAQTHTNNCVACFLVSHSEPLSFCRLSLQYHPDKNKNKGAQEKFAEINNGIVQLFHFSFLLCVMLFL